MHENKDFLEISYMSIEVFKDGKLDYHELDKLIEIALKDRVIDDNERRVLESIFAKLTKEELTPAVKTRLDQIKIKYNIPSKD